MFTFDDEREFKLWLDAGYLCPGCGCSYRHLFKVRALGDGEDEALGRARRRILRVGLADIPCPDCGRVTAPIHRSRNPLIGAAFVIAAIGALVVSFGAWKIQLLKIGGGSVAVACSFLFAIAFSGWILVSRNRANPKRRRAARERIEAKRLHDVRSAAGSPDPSLGSFGGSARAFVGVWLGVAIFASVGIGVPSVSDSYNPDVTPGFLAPGDEAVHIFPETLSTVKGHWRGTPRIGARTVPEREKPLRIVGEGRHDRWPEEFFVKAHEHRVPVRPSARFRIPAQAELEGQTIDLAIHMDVEYPKANPEQDGREFRYQVEEQLLESQFKLKLVSTESSNRLQAAWWVAFGFAAFLIAVPPLVVAVRCWQERNARHILDLEQGIPPAKPVVD